MAKLRIYPAIGVARVGNSKQSFIGPENPGIPANWDSNTRKFKRFKDDDGRILRQAARFRIFEFDEGGNPLKELTLADGFKIEWRIHVANRKASFFSFNGQSGARTGEKPPYVDREQRPANDIEKARKGRGYPERKNKRNADIADRRGLEIDPGEVAISVPGTVELIDSTTHAPIQFLGEAQMQPDGGLLFLGGFGRSEAHQNALPIEEYASNDGWFDDMCDGVIRARVTFPDGHTEQADSAWVIVGPPDFAPGIGNVVSLYDTIWDLSVRFRLPCQAGNDPDLQDLISQQQSWQDQTSDLAATYEPSFTRHVYPILSRALAAQDVHVSSRRSFHDTIWDWPRLASRAEAKIRQSVFNRLRDPNSEELNRKGMPRGLGDDFTSLDEFETDQSNPQPSPRAFLSLTRVQYAILKAWSQGRFKEDWSFGEDLKYVPIPAPTPITPHGLNIAALENCVGGPFFPGIEVSWLVREIELYASAFRFKETGFSIGPLAFQAGFFSQQMALPWHADFYDCQREEHTPPGSDEQQFYMWWTAQRPDFIRADAESPYRRWVEKFDPFKEPDAPDPDDITNLARFEQMRTRWPELSFVVLDGEENVEQK
ncbi:MAG TPA: LodA/GoxA family CTQ-dependent oxidase [Terriglobia bacterium]|nr:LodA/GoxA family CTQ-dependent oxidase [Terriglobia bacterium]